jgi:cytidylate kinase
MSVITISRGSFSGGKLLAECLARKLGYRCVDRDVIVEKAAASGVSQQELLDAILKPPTFLERLTHKKYLYLTLIQAALTEELRSGRAVYHGNAGHLLLQGGAPILRVRVIAPVEFRVKMAMARLRLTRQEAIEYIERRDLERRKWTHYLYGVDWTDPALYDMVINLEYLTIEDACISIAAMVRSQPCFQFGPQCQAVLNDLALASQVKAKLALEPSTHLLEFNVTARDGIVSIRGKLTSIDLLPEVERVASSVPGVRELVLDEVAPVPQV